MKPVTQKPTTAMTTSNAVLSGADQFGVTPSKKPKPTRRTKTTTQTTSKPSPGLDESSSGFECEEQYAPHEQDCNKFYQCIFGQYTETA